MGFSMSELRCALPEIEPHRLVPVELMAGGIIFIALGLYLVGSDLLFLGYVQPKSLILGLTVTGFGFAMSAIGYTLRAWYGRRDETGGALAKTK